MNFTDFLHALKRHRLLILLAAAAGLVAGFVSAPGSQQKVANFQAEATLIANPRAESAVNLDQAVLLVGTGDVPRRAAAALGPGNDPVTISKAVHANSDSNSNSMTIRAVDRDPARAAALADQFGAALNASLADQDRAAYQASIDEQQARVDQLRTQLAGIQASLEGKAPEDPATLDERADASVTQASYQDALSTLDTLRQSNGPVAPLVTLDVAHPSVVAASGVEVPASKPLRALLGALIGLLAGILGALLLDRLDTRLHSKLGAERAFGVSVVGEIPPLPSRSRHGTDLLALSSPSDPFVEAYRSLRTVVLLGSVTGSKLRDVTDTDVTNGANGNGATQPHDPTRGTGGRVVLITSPGAGEGKTTTAAHLAALLAEAHRSVLVVSADFRRPRVHLYFGTRREPGLAEMLSDETDVPELSKLILRTNVDNVWLLPSGAPIDNPSPYLEKTVEIIRAAREVFDFIIVDSAPMLVANDAAELAQAADMVLVLGRASRTTIEAARSSAEILSRVKPPLVGAVLVATDDTPTAYAYYRYRYYGSQPRHWWQRRPRDGEPPSRPREAADATTTSV